VTISLGLIIGVVAGVLFIIILLIIGFVVYKQRVDKKQKELMADYTSQIQNVCSRCMQSHACLSLRHCASSVRKLTTPAHVHLPTLRVWPPIAVCR